MTLITITRTLYGFVNSTYDTHNDRFNVADVFNLLYVDYQNIVV